MEHRLDEVLHELRSSYNVPPALPPLEAMWARIDEELDTTSVAAPAGAGAASADIVPLHAARSLRHRGARSAQRYTHWLGIAAALVIGVGLGRVSVQPAVVQVGAPLASGTDVAQPRPKPGLERLAETGSAEPRVAEATSAPSVVASTPRSAPSGAQAPEPRAVLTGGGNTATVRSASRTSATADAPDDVYDAAGSGTSTDRYLVQATALLIALANDAPKAGDDARLARRAGVLLTTTRLLLDAPSTDAKARALLEDLELVLAQVVRLQSESGRQELKLIREALEQRDLLPRLHTAVVSGSDD